MAPRLESENVEDSFEAVTVMVEPRHGVFVTRNDPGAAKRVLTHLVNGL
ncbi:MAG: hypothetical protein M3305_00125 [Actinomycetota bacterium]|nr:hypothetical protein [Actinomycetota bacterium]